MKNRSIDIVAHRGLSRIYPENTLPAFENAAKLDICAIEFDVHLTRDGIPVVTHDDTVERCSNGQGSVRDLSLAELKKMDFGGWKSAKFCGLQIPTLDETIHAILAVNPGIRLLIEIKENDPLCAEAVLRKIKGYERSTQWMLSSFHADIIHLLRELDRNCLLHGSEDHNVSYDDKPFPELNSIGLSLDCLSSQRAAYLKGLGLRVDAWVVDDESQLRRALACGVDSVTSDAADEIITILACIQ